MTSKGIEFYSAVHGPAAAGDPIKVRLFVDGGEGKEFLEGVQPYGHGHVEVERGGLFFTESSREVHLTVHCGTEVFRVTQLIDTQWPKLPDGPLADTFKTPTRFVDTPRGKLAVSYGFGDTSGQHASDLLYVTVTPVYSDWMGELVGAHPGLRDRAFSTFSLPGAHDAGMYGPGESIHTTIDALMGGAIAPAMLIPLGPVGAAIAALLAMGSALDLLPTAVVNSAFVQKDDVKTLLDLGIRYFDFRPGVPLGEDALAHIHSVVPGCELAVFLSQTLRWLEAHPTEIAVIRFSDDGIYHRLLPNAAKVEDVVRESFDTSTIRRGGIGDLTRTVSDLLAGNTRLLMVRKDNYHGSWTSAYETDDVNVIKDKLATMKVQATGADQIALELQSSGTKDGLVLGAKNRAYGQLIKTKPVFRDTLYPWVRENAPKKFAQGLLVLMDDFADGSLTRLAIDLTTSRLGHQVTGRDSTP
ncbi:hypothetical protein [Actinocrispum sp. NPDC049592]|uniref:hypothetical protein n=1 Tax=Actinocrispum sp. NPDC049592 TaxID=3154835 RepID=UPI00342AB8F4